MACLNSIYNSLTKFIFEVIVIDNNSKDKTCKLIQENFKNCFLIRNKRNFGFSHAVNQGFYKSQGEILLILNPDVKILPTSIEKALNYMHSDPKVAVLLPKLLNPDESLQYSCRTFYDLPTLLLRRTFLGRLLPDHKLIRRHLMMDFSHNVPLEVDWGLGACMFIRRSTLDGNFIFDNRFFLYFEDVDLCLRMKQRGFKVIYYPESVMVHTHIRQSARKFLNRAKWEHFLSFLKFLLKHGGLRPKE